MEKGRQEDGAMKAIPAKGLWKSTDSARFAWKEVLISEYDQKSETFKGHWLDNKQPATLTRIQMCFDVSSGCSSWLSVGILG